MEERREWDEEEAREQVGLSRRSNPSFLWGKAATQPSHVFLPNNCTFNIMLVVMQTVEDRKLLPFPLVICNSSWGGVHGPLGWLLCSRSIWWEVLIRKFEEMNVQYSPLESDQSQLQKTHAFSYHFLPLCKTERIWVAGRRQKSQSC